VEEERVLIVIDVGEQVAVGGDGGAAFLVVLEVVAGDGEVVGGVDETGVVPGAAEPKLLVVIDAVREKLLFLAKELDVPVQNGDVGFRIVEPPVGEDGVFFVDEVRGRDEVGNLIADIVTQGITVHSVVGAAKEYGIVEIGVVGVGEVAADDAGERVGFVENLAASDIVAAVDVEVVEEAVGEEVGFSVLKADSTGEDSLSDVAVVGSALAVKVDRIADDEVDGMTVGYDVVVGLVEVSAVAVADHVVLFEFDVADESLGTREGVLVIVAHIGAVEDTTVPLSVHLTDKQNDKGNYERDFPHSLFQQGGVGSLPDDAVVPEGDFTPHLT